MDVARFATELLAAVPAWTWKGAALLAVAVVADLALRHRAAALRHLVWSGSLAGLLALPLAQPLLPELAVPVPMAPPSATWSVGGESATAPRELGGVTGASPAAASASPQPEAVAAGASCDRDAAPVAQAASPPPAAGSPATATAASGAGSVARPAPRNAAPTRPFDLAALAPVAPGLLAALWALGALAVAARLGASLLRRRRLLATARPLDAEWEELAAACAERLHLGRRFRLLATVETEVPMTWGILSPVVLLPAVARRWPEPQRRTVLLHELAHVRRVDALGLAVSQLACIVHWFDPLTWLAAHRLRSQAEHACDDLVLLSGSRPSQYAGHLVEIARALRSALPSPAVTLPMARRAQLSERVAAILDHARERRTVSRGAAGVVAALAALLVVPLAAARPRPVAVPALAPVAPVAAAAGLAIPGPILPPRPGVPLTPAVAPGAAPCAGDCATPASAPAPPLPDAPPPDAPPPGAALAPAAPVPGAAAVAAVAPVAGAPGALPAAAVVGSWSAGVPAPPAPPAPPPPPAPPAAAAPRAVPAVPAVPAAPAPPAPPARHGTSFSYSSSDGDAASDWGRGCARGNGHSRSTNILVDDDGDWKIRIREGGCALDVDIRGDVAFNADETAIARIARDGRMRVYERRGDREREMVVTAGADGRPVVVWEVDGERRPWDDAARGWFAQLVPELFRLTGIDAEGRVGRLLARGGVDAVLTEVGRIDSDTVAAKYLRELLRQADPTPEQVGRIVTVAVRGIDSDHELSNLLLSAIELRGAEAVVSAAFLDACDAIDSDHDARRVLSEIVRRGQQPAAVDRALGCLRGVDSDHDTAEVLVLVPPRWPVGQPLPASFYTAARGVGSDHDRRRSLEAATARRPLPAGDVRNVLALAGAFGSDHDLAGVLVSVAAATRLEGELASAFVAAADRIGSDHDRARAMEALARSSHGLR